MAIRARALFFEAANQPLVARDLELAAPSATEAIVQVLACGLCHTDLGFFDGGTPTKHALPLVLGHEAVGKVIDAGERFRHLVGKDVIVPAVLPCGDCDFCRAGRGNACPRQAMPGNDIHGGFATHMLVPAAPLQVVEKLPAGLSLTALGVVADAVTTAYQAVKRAEVKAGDLCFVVGAGGVGGFAIQIASALGAEVVAFDVSDERLTMMQRFGAKHVVNVRGKATKDVRKEATEVAKKAGVSSLRWRIFECSGTKDGQALAFALQNRGTVYAQVGYTPDALEVRLSNLMAFDATMFGTWGCPPERYPEVLALIAAGKVQIEPFVEVAPMSRLNELLADMKAHKLHKRMVLTPDL